MIRVFCMTSTPSRRVDEQPDVGMVEAGIECRRDRLVFAAGRAEAYPAVAGCTNADASGRSEGSHAHGGGEVAGWTGSSVGTLAAVRGHATAPVGRPVERGTGGAFAASVPAASRPAQRARLGSTGPARARAGATSCQGECATPACEQLAAPAAVCCVIRLQ